MDSKTRMLTIFSMLGIMVLVGLVVVFTNQDKLGISFGKKQTVVSEDVRDGEETGKAQDANLTAFLQDESFFDQEEVALSGDIKEEIAGEESDTRLTLLATSIEKDLRIKVVDDNGKAVAGYPFLVNIEGVGTFEDEDKDGLIYVSDLKQGKYEISLQEMKGFTVPTDSLTARVKAIVSYTVIEDISYLICSESEIDASVEDLGKKEIDAEDEDDTQYTELMNEVSMEDAVALGVDVSKYQKKIDWETVAQAGVEFAIIRLGYRGMQSGALVEDPYFKENLKGAKEAGIKVGVYFFSQAVNAVEAVEEASMAIALLEGEELDYPIFIDTEGGGGTARADSIDAATRTLVCQYFCKTIQNEGYKAGVYSGRNYYYNKLQADALEEYTIWLAEYRETPLYENRYDMWQYTSKGTVAGIEGNVDLNVSYLGY